MTRKILSALFVISAALTLVVAGFSLRNVVADRFRMFLTFHKLSEQQVNKLELDAQSDPTSLADRIKLLEFYSSKKISGQLSPNELINRRKHILWVITNQPSSSFAGDFAMQFEPKDEEPDPEGRQEAKNLWIQQVKANPDNVRILYNTSEFFASIYDYTSSETYLEHAQAIGPAAYDVANSLGIDYWHDARYAPDSEKLRTSSIKAINMFEQALKNASSKDERRFVLPNAAQAAFEAGDYPEATRFSKEMLKIAEEPEQYRDYGDEVHYGNIVLGRIALRQGDTSTAASYLVKSGAVEGNPHLDTFGPNMMLAKELLEKGADKPVLAFLDSCRTFWKDDDGKLAKWHSDVSNGQMPDFGPNLHY